MRDSFTNSIKCGPASPQNVRGNRHLAYQCSTNGYISRKLWRARGRAHRRSSFNTQLTNSRAIPSIITVLLHGIVSQHYQIYDFEFPVRHNPGVLVIKCRHVLVPTDISPKKKKLTCTPWHDQPKKSNQKWGEQATPGPNAGGSLLDLSQLSSG